MFLQLQISAWDAKQNKYQASLVMNKMGLANDRTISCLLYSSHCKCLCASVNFSPIFVCNVNLQFFFFTSVTKCQCSIFGNPTTSTKRTTPTTTSITTTATTTIPTTITTKTSTPTTIITSSHILQLQLRQLLQLQ